MAFTYDLSTNVGKIRLFIPDNNESVYNFEDGEIEAFYAIEGSSLKRAAALALETIARNEVMVLKVIQILDLRTDGAAVARELRFQAENLRKQADDEEVAAGGAFDIAEMVLGPFGWREHVDNLYLRG